jgi:hypothetical protein
MTLRLGLDLDGPLVNWNHANRELLAKVAGRENLVPTHESPAGWDYAETLGYTAEHQAEAYRQMHADKAFWATLPPAPGAVRFLDWLWRSVSLANWTATASHEIYFLTARAGTRAKDQSELWLKNHGFAGMVPTVLMARGGKGRLAKALHLTHFLDDNVDHVRDVKRHVPTCDVCLLSATYNAHAHESLRFADISVLDSLADFQAKIAGEL